MEFVYDRTEADVMRGKELNARMLAGTATEKEAEEWAAGMKGALNVADLNRIEGNCRMIGDKIAVPVTVKSWIRTDFPRISDYARIRKNVDGIRKGYGIMSDTPPVPAQPLNTYQKWNDIEKILHDVDYVFTQVQNDRFYCGMEVYAGEGVGLL